MRVYQLLLLTMVSFGLTRSNAGSISAVSYDMPNGSSSIYLDDLYDGAGDRTTPGARLTGGLGELTDGVIAEQSWWHDRAPYVNWTQFNGAKQKDPTIAFSFDQPTQFESITLSMDDSKGFGNAGLPRSVAINGFRFDVTETNERVQSHSFDISAIRTDRLEVQLFHGQWNHILLSEVQFTGEPTQLTPCRRGCGRSLIKNGSFELAGPLVDGTLPGAFHLGADDPSAPLTGAPDVDVYTLVPGSMAIDSWEAFDPSPNDSDEPFRGSIDWNPSSYLAASDGNLSIDLAGTPGPGGIRQTIETVPGEEYRIEFDLAANPIGRDEPVHAGIDEVAPAVKRMRVRATGDTLEASADFDFDSNRGGELQGLVPTTPTDMGWSRHEWRFVATDELTTLEFLSLERDVAPDHFHGIVLDNVAAYRSASVPEPSGTAIGLACLLALSSCPLRR